jgi:hypothetical protein
LRALGDLAATIAEIAIAITIAAIAAIGLCCRSMWKGMASSSVAGTTYERNR